MRPYSKILSQFWIGETGRMLRTAGADAQVVALYLLSSPHANMLGLYYLPITYIAHETGLSLEAARAALNQVEAIGFCGYDSAAEVVWVMEMAKFQIGAQLNPKDHQLKSVPQGDVRLFWNGPLTRFDNFVGDWPDRGSVRPMRRRAFGDE